MASLDFNKMKKQYLTVTLNDENQTTLMIMTPNKNILDEIIEVQGSLGSSDEIENIDVLYEICAKAMNRNKGGIKITEEFLESIFDIEDTTIFIKAYMEFVTKQIQEKN